MAKGMQDDQHRNVDLAEMPMGSDKKLLRKELAEKPATKRQEVTACLRAQNSG
jgi:hypothetical protein